MSALFKIFLFGVLLAGGTSLACPHIWKNVRRRAQVLAGGSAAA